LFGLGLEMAKKSPQYGATAKMLHWLILGLLIIQYLIGWFMADVKKGQQPGLGMTWHISIGTAILLLIIVRLSWRITHPVMQESSLDAFQRVASEGVHWLLYVLVLASTITGYVFASAHGWIVYWFYLFPLPMVTGPNQALESAINHWHQKFLYALLILVGLHVFAALVHLVYYRDGVMRRMLPAFRK
jgi:cytochrome b561